MHCGKNFIRDKAEKFYPLLFDLDSCLTLEVETSYGHSTIHIFESTICVKHWLYIELGIHGIENGDD